MGYPLHAGVVYWGRDFTSWSIGKGWQNCHLGIKRDFQSRTDPPKSLFIQVL